MTDPEAQAGMGDEEGAATLTDEEIETRRSQASETVPADDTGDDAGDDFGDDSGDDAGDPADPGDVGDDAGDDAGDDSAA